VELALNEIAAAAQIAYENEAGICRVTAGWKKPHLSLDVVRPYWRDAHSPTIARRAGIWEYRHYPLDPVRADLVPALAGIDMAPPPDAQLMWLSDVRYRDAAGLEAFGRSPPPGIRAHILGDIEMIVDLSTTYVVLGANGETLADRTGDGAPLGPARWPNFALFIRQRGTEGSFRAAARAFASGLAGDGNVLRVRLSLFEVPDMEAERRSGYPIKTHPQPQQYQAWIDLVVKHEESLRGLLERHHAEMGGEISALHAFPAPAVYTFNYRGRPTLAGLRGYPAHEAISNLQAVHQKQPELLSWLYGPVAQDAPYA
jgi:hypothetical protein